MNRLNTRDSVATTDQESSFDIARAQFDRVADRLNLDATMRDLLRSPMREFHFAIPIRMDDGTHRVFRGLRVQHNDARGHNAQLCISCRSGRRGPWRPIPSRCRIFACRGSCRAGVPHTGMGVT
jgi:hypothetical protein